MEMKKLLFILLSIVFASNVASANETDSTVVYIVEDDSVALDSVALDSAVVEKEEKITNAISLFTMAPTDVITLGYENRYQIAYNDTLPYYIFDGDTCRVTHRDSAYMEIDVAPNYKYQLVLPKDDLVMLISTHALPQQDSEIAFYDFEWNKLPLKKYFKTPLLSDWLTNEGKKNRATVEKKLPFLLVKYYYDVDSKILTLTNNLHTYFISSEWDKISPFMKKELRYKWNGKKFNKIK